MQNRLRRPPTSRTLRPLALAALAVIAVLALPAPALGAGFRIRAHIRNHAPVVGRRWPVELTITRGRRRLHGTVRYEFLFAGVVVKTQPQRGSFKFRHGVYRDELVFPKQSLGEHLTLRFVVRTRYGTEHLDWPLETRR